MAVYVTEHGGIGRYRQPYTGAALASYSLSSASTAPFPSANATYVRVSADAASLINLISTSTGLALTSTNAFRIPANAQPEIFACSTSMRITAQST
jgi:hypothetical protein